MERITAMNNRIQLLMVLKYIMEKSTESEPVSNADILSYLASENMNPCKMTLIEDLKVIKKSGYDLITIKKGKTNYYYIPSEHFDTTEARLITDSLVSAKFVTPSATERLLSKVLRLTDKEMEQHFINDIVIDFRLKHRNCNTTYSIDAIQGALSKGKRLNFRYFDLDENKNRVYRHNNKIYEVFPITMINGMDNYYLIAYDPHSGCRREKTFRIDRMEDTVISKKNIGDIPFDRDECIQRYRSSVFSMYSGHRVMAEFEFDFKAMNIIYDKYGEDTKITKIGEDRYYAKLPVEDSPTFWGWIFMLEDRIRILSPTYLVNEYAEKLKHINTIVNYS